MDEGTGVGAGLFGLSALSFAAAPAVLPSSYSWIEHTTSEAGSQQTPGAWLARTGFILFGLGVLWVCYKSRIKWRRLGLGLHLTFAVCMLAVAAYSSRSWDAHVGFDQTEDFLHSAGATVMGFAFALGVLAVAMTDYPPRFRLRDLAAMVSAVAIPLAMVNFPSIDGLLQRMMFLVAYFWYTAELVGAGAGGTKNWLSR